MSTWTSTITESFDDASFDLDKLKVVLGNVGIQFEFVALLENGEFQSFTDEFLTAMDELECSARVSFTAGCMYERNGDPGYPDESDFEDLEIENVNYLGKTFNIVSCLNAKALEELEIKITEKEDDRDCGFDGYDER